MAKSTHPVTPVQTGTHPVTRIISGNKVQAAKQPVGTPGNPLNEIAYAQRVPLSDSAKAGGKDVPLTEGDRTSLQRPSDVKVETEH